MFVKGNVNKMRFGFQFLLLSLLVIISIGIQPVFAEKIVSIQKIVDVDKESLTKSLSSLDKYTQILPDYIQSSKLIGYNTAQMKIGLDWTSIDAKVKFVESNNKVTLEVISGDLKGTKLYVIMSEKTKNTQNKMTDVSAKIQLQMSWYMEMLTSLVSEKDIKSMLNTSLDGVVEYTKNPPPPEKIVEEEKFCIFSLCF